MINITLFESLVTERDFLDKKFPDHHNVINVLANDGKLYRYHRYAGERELLTKIAETPIRFVDKTQLVERRQIVPGGVRVPMQLLKDIENFFRAFMIKNVTSAAGYRPGHGDYEAMALILYNLDTQQYRVSIPAQKVSKASVSYDIDDKADNEIVVVDIHSHNSMGAFFSGVDDRDDRSGAWVTGVLGKLDQPEFASVWRFNAGATKVQLTIADIFETPTITANPVDQAWMDKVQVGYSSYGGTPYYQRPVGGAQVGNSKVGGAQVGNHNFQSEAKSPRIYGAEVGGLGGGKSQGGFGKNPAGFPVESDFFDQEAYEELMDMLGVDGLGSRLDLDDDIPFEEDEVVGEADASLVRQIDKLLGRIENEHAYGLVVENIVQYVTNEAVLVDMAGEVVDRITDGIPDLTERGIYVITDPEQVVDAMADMCGEYLHADQIATAFNEISEAQGVLYTYTPKE